MSSQDDLGMLWYGLSGVSFNPTDPAEVMLNTSITAPLLSDHPRALVAPQVSQTTIGPHTQQGNISYGDPLSQHNQVLYDPQTGDFINQTDYMYETYDGYEEDSTSTNGLNSQNQQLLVNSHQNHNEEEQNFHPRTKKPKVHQHPALKLKTPIAYQKDTDLNAIPIMKEGMAVCEKCGAIGVKHAFYGKERKFCSLACARPPMSNSHLFIKGNSDLVKVNQKLDNTNSELKQETEENSDPKQLSHSNSSVNSFHFQGQDESTKASQDAKRVSSPSIHSPYEFDSRSKDSIDLYQHLKGNQNDSDDFNETSSFKSLQNCSSAASSSPSPRATPTYMPPPLNAKEDLSSSFDWESTYLNSESFEAASVKSFKHAPMSECWEQISPGMKVEVSCGEESWMKDAFWVATVIAICGYRAKLRFEGFVDDDSKDFWVDLCSEEVHPVGWCATQGKPLIPPKTIQFKYKDWKEFLMKRLTGARTLPTNFHSKVVESLKSRFRPGLNLEVVDKNRIAQMRVATVTKVIGKRLHLRYHGAPPDDNGFWCHEDAAIIHPVGWSREVGHEIVASQSYHEKCMEVAYDPDDATSDLFVYPHRSSLVDASDLSFGEGMKLEAIDPLNLATVCVATVMKVLSHNYLMIRIDSYDSDNTCSDWFCYHAASTSIFPAGFCEMNGIPLTPPRGYEGQFSWYNYLTKTQAIAASPTLFTRDIPNHGFKGGMSIEAADLMDPRLVCVANIKEVKGRLLKIHFDGWETDFDQWVDCQSADIYPVGWCNLVSYKLEGPRLTVPMPFVQRKKVRGRGGRKGRPFGSRRGSFARGAENASPGHQSPLGGQMIPSSMGGKRGRKPRQRGASHLTHHLRENQPGAEEFAYEQDSSNDLSYCAGDANSFRGRRGRPRKNPLRNSNHDSQSQSHRPTRTTRTALPSYVQSEDEASGCFLDETSSGVASLAGSENSSEAWEMEQQQYDMTPMQQAPPETSEGVAEVKNEEVFVVDHLTPLPNDTAYRDGFKGISEEAVLFGDDAPNFDSFLTTPDAKENLPLSDNSSDFRVTSSFDVALTNESVTSSPKETMTSLPNQSMASSYHLNPVTSSSEEGLAAATAAAAGASLPSFIEEPSKDLLLPPLPELLPVTSTELMDLPLPNPHPPPSHHASLLPPPSHHGGPHPPPSQHGSPHYIPRIIDNSNVLRGGKIQPKLWSHCDVTDFLKANDCGAYCNNFVAQKIDGKRFLMLAQNEVMELTGMKVGPSLKIHDLIQQLLAIVNPAQARYQATLLKRGLTFGKT